MEFQLSVASTLTTIATRPANMLPVHLSARNRVLRGGIEECVRSWFRHSLNPAQRNGGLSTNLRYVNGQGLRSVQLSRRGELDCGQNARAFAARSPELN